jgi:hypothetical protein
MSQPEQRPPEGEIPDWALAPLKAFARRIQGERQYLRWGTESNE